MTDDASPELVVKPSNIDDSSVSEADGNVAALVSWVVSDSETVERVDAADEGS